MIRVLIADDYGVVREGLRGLIDAEPDMEVIAVAADGHEAVARSLVTEPDVVLMDLNMPTLDGIEATRRLLADRPHIAVLVLTAFSDRPRILGALEAGAVGYLLKDLEPGSVTDGIRAAARGEAPLDPRAARTLLSARAEQDPLKDLSPRECEVLDLLLEGLANKRIARRLGISEGTVKAHLTNIFRAIGVTDRTQAALWARRHGLGPGNELWQ